MIKLFCAVCILGSVLFLTHAVFSSFYETGNFIYIAPMIFTLVSGLFVAMLLRKPWSRLWVFSLSWACVLINLLFPPSPADFGAMTTFARILVGAEVFVCIVMLICMPVPAVVVWFSQPQKN
jgi:hypothetical protein